MDYTIGIPLILAAVAINELLPARMSAMFWVYRVDLFSLPIFVAGAVAIIFGCRVLWRQRLAIAFLFLAWPYPYQKYLLGVLNAFTSVTLLAMQKIAVVDPPRHARRVVGQHAVLSHITTARPSPSASCLHAPGSTAWSASCWSARPLRPSSVVPLCARFCGSLGGMVLLWALNLGRITFIFFAGREWGESVAINVFHPFIGLVMFCVGVIVMLLLIRPLGMHYSRSARRALRLRSDATRHPSLPLGPPAEAQKRKVTLAVPKVYLAVVAVVVAALVIGVSNVGLSTYNLVAGVAGEREADSVHPGPGGAAGLVGTVRDDLRVGETAVR